MDKSHLLTQAKRISEKDSYLNKLLNDWEKESNLLYKDHIAQEVFDYTEEVLRKEDKVVKSASSK